MKSAAIITSAALLASILLTGCSEDGSLVKLTYENDRFVSKRARLSYNYAPLSYEPAVVGDPYAYCTDPDIFLCDIPGLDPKKWLTEEYAGTSTTVLYSEDITLPTLGEIEADTVYLCMAGERVFSLAEIRDDTGIQRLTDAFLNGEPTRLPHSEATTVYSLKFSSVKDLPGLYYTILYGEYAEGNFLYAVGDDRCVEVGDLLNEVLDGGAE